MDTKTANNRKPSTLTGKEAIDHARAHGSTLSKYNDRGKRYQDPQAELTAGNTIRLVKALREILARTARHTATMGPDRVAGIKAAATRLVVELEPSMSPATLDKLKADGVSDTSIRFMLLDLT